MLRAIEQWLFPPLCCLCDQGADTEQDLCSICKASLPWIKEACFRCGLFIGTETASIYCERCLESPPHFDRLCALFHYLPPVTHLITALKFKANLTYAKLLGNLLADASEKVWYQNSALPEALLPVPLHIDRLRKRGFNQTVELLKACRNRFAIPILTDACIRTRSTAAQARLNKSKRKKNMKNAFTLIKPLPFEHIAILDDVVTTGSTANALAGLLKENGVKSVDIWCIGRA